MLSESILRSISRYLLLVLIALLMAVLFVACGDQEGDQEEEKENAAQAMTEQYSESYLDSLLGSLVPQPKHVSGRFKEWLGKQKNAIRAEIMDPEMVVDAIRWHRAEVSEAAQIEGYTTYPLVAHWETRIKLDSLVPLTIAELNRQPVWAQPAFFHPGRKSGVVFGSGLMANLTEAIELAGDTISSTDQFGELCLGFMEMAFRDAQIIVTDSLQWCLFQLADSLANRNPGAPASTRLADALVQRVEALESVERLDTLAEALALREYLDENESDWLSNFEPPHLRETRPSFRRGIYRWQVTILDSYSLQTRVSTFYFDKERGFWLEDVEVTPPVRMRLQMG